MDDSPVPLLSETASRLEPGKIGAACLLFKSLTEEGHDVINLAIGEPDFPTPDAISQAGIEAIRSGFTKYTQITGIPELRDAISKKLKGENGLPYDAEEIVLSGGAHQAAYQAIAAVCGAGDEVLIPAPYWASYPSKAALTGATPIVLPCPMSDGFFLRPEVLKEALTPKSRLLILCTPSNPTGAMYSRERLEDIAEVVRSHPNLLVLSDEIYEYIAYPPVEHVSFASLPGMFNRTLTVNGFSKSFAMTGWRLGYVAAPLPYATACGTIQSHTTGACCAISQKAGVAALKMGYKGGTIVADMVQTYRSKRDYVMQRLKGMAGMSVLVPDGAFYVFPDVTAFVGDGARVDGYGSIENVDRLCDYLARKGHVLTVPGEAFGADGHIRISYAAPMEILEKAMDRMASVLSVIQK